MRHAMLATLLPGALALASVIVIQPHSWVIPIGIVSLGAAGTWIISRARRT